MKTFILILLSAVIVNAQFIKGVDISTLEEMEDLGVVYKNGGSPQNVVYMMANNGVNYIRLKLWHTPSNKYNDLQSVIRLAQRAKLQGCKILLNFHYSDTWADPSAQNIPAAWQGLGIEDLKDSLYNYTYACVSAMKEAGVMPDMVQLGNEILCGFLWYEGYVCLEQNTQEDWTDFTDLLKTGRQAVHDVLEDGEECKIMIHIAEGGNKNVSQYYYNKLRQYGVPYDVIGLSYYPWWHGSVTNLEENVKNLSLVFQKDIIIVETGYPWTLTGGDQYNNFVWNLDQLPDSFEPTPEGQKEFLQYLFSTMQKPEYNKVTGIFYWAPDLTIAPGFSSVYENIALFDYNGNSLPALDVYNDTTTSVKSEALVPDKMELYQNYPNPFNPETRISFYLPEAANVKISVCTILGEKLRILEQGYKPAGSYNISFDATNLPSGVYFYILEAGNKVMYKKMSLVK